MTTKEFVKKYAMEPSLISDSDIIAVIYLGFIFVHGEGKSSNEFGVAVFPPLGQQFPDRATVGKAVSAGLKLHRVTDDGVFVYLFDAANEEQARAAIQVAGFDRCQRTASSTISMKR